MVSERPFKCSFIS